jgi:hypothetical protein
MSSWYRRLPCSKAASPLPADGCVSIPWPPKVSGAVHQLIFGAPLISAEHLGMQSSETCGRPGEHSVHHRVSASRVCNNQGGANDRTYPRKCFARLLRASRAGCHLAGGTDHGKLPHQSPRASLHTHSIIRACRRRHLGRGRSCHHASPHSVRNPIVYAG